MKTVIRMSPQIVARTLAIAGLAQIFGGVGLPQLDLARGAGFGISSAFGQAGGASQTDAPSRNTSKWNVDKKSKLAIVGYDPVAYFPEGGSKAVKGDARFALNYGGVVYYFANAEHKKLFEANPSRYEPAHGGWCSWAMKDGEQVDIEPKNFIVKDDRLFLFYDGFFGDTRAKWLKQDHAAQAKTADDKWKSSSGETPRMAGIDAVKKSASADLKSQLDAISDQYASKMPEEVKAKLAKGAAELDATGVEARAMKVGMEAPEFQLADSSGQMRSLTQMLKDGPVVLTFYRGDWCPYCNTQLSAYQEIEPEVRKAGGQLVAMSPQKNEDTAAQRTRLKLDYVLISDVGNAVAKQYGVSYAVPPSIKGFYQPILTKSTGDAESELPLAATYVIGTDRKIAYSYVSTDYRKRAEPTDILVALNKLNKAGVQ